MAAVAMDSARSSGSTDIGNDQLENIKFGNPETKLGDSVLSAHFIKELENFYNKADTRDKQKCLELITSVGLGEDLKRQMKKLQRCRTALSAYGRGSGLNPYQTTYERDYPHKTGRQPWALRPTTTVGYITTVPESKPLGPTLYDTEFCQKFQRPASPERAATASGQRNNKPHPSQSFLVWKFPSKTRYSQDGDFNVAAELTDQKLSQITKRLCHSVYQNDYLGIPQGFQVNSAFNLPSNWKDNVPYGLNTSQRQTFQLPQQQKELTVPTTRYGSNSRKQDAAMAVVPTANKRLFGVGGRTTYDRHYNDNAGLLVEQIRNNGKELEADVLRKIYMSSGEDNEQAGKLLEGFEEPKVRVRTPLHKPECPTPTASSRSMSAPPATQRNRSKFPVENGCKRGCNHPRASPVARTEGSTYKLNLSVSPPTGTILPPKFPFHVQMPAAPLSVPYTPPMFLS